MENPEQRNCCLTPDEIREFLATYFDVPGLYLIRRGRLEVGVWASSRTEWKDVHIVSAKPEVVLPAGEPGEEQERP